MHRPEMFWVLSDACSLWWLQLRGTLLLFGGRLLGDEFMKLAGRFDLRQARRRPRSGGALRRIHMR
ncbi:MAG: hypothetical protein NTW15_09505 [Burkholderiales bacterium]|nr:hypothetical protein [Burkholderiales bacterium]